MNWFNKDPIFKKFNFLIIFLNLLSSTKACDIVGASVCSYKPENSLKDEHLDDYCQKYKAHLECVYSKYKDCDKNDKYVEAMESMIKGLRKKARKIEQLCDFDINVPEEVKKKIEKFQANFRHNGYTTPKTPIVTLPACKIKSISIDCHSILTNFQFMNNWNGVMKQKWCNSATNYYNCVKTRLLNCYAAQFQESVAYYEKIQKYVHSQSNINCPGGIEGCAANPIDIRCKLGVKYGETNSASYSSSNLNFFYFLFFILFF